MNIKEQKKWFEQVMVPTLVSLYKEHNEKALYEQLDVFGDALDEFRAADAQMCDFMEGFNVAIYMAASGETYDKVDDILFNYSFDRDKELLDVCCDCYDLWDMD